MLFIRLSMYPGPSSPPVARRSTSAVWNASKSRIHSIANSCERTSVLLNTRMKGRRVLYRMLYMDDERVFVRREGGTNLQA